jgi:hypothetical protein
VIGLGFEFQRPIATITGGATMSPDNRHLILPELAPGHSVSIHINYLQLQLSSAPLKIETRSCRRT